MNKVKSKNRILQLIIVFLSASILSLLCVAGYMYFHPMITDNEIHKIQEEVVVDNSKDERTIDWEALYDKNEDVVAWLEIPNTNIDTPILQGPDNQYYLKKDINKKYAYCGNSFLDYRNSLNMTDKVSIIYGHNMINGTSFGKLTKYYGGSAPEEGTNIIYYYTPSGKHTYVVYGAFYTNAFPEDDNGYCFAYNTPSMGDEKYDKYLKQIDVRCLYTDKNTINTTNKLLLLSTCAYQFRNERFVVVAKEVGDEEYQPAYIQNEQPKYPQKYYDKRHRKNPYYDFEKWYPNF